jgi:hypothetical protein
MTTIESPLTSATTAVSAISFRVDDVEQSNKKLSVADLREQIIAGMGKKPHQESKSENGMYSLLSCNEKAQDPYRILGLYRDMGVLNQSYKRNHPLLHAVHEAFANHLALTLSPDVFWQTILQGVAQHIAEYPEEHRSLFVKHDGKKIISIFRSDLSLSDLDAIGAATGSIVEDFLKNVNAEMSPAYFKVLNQGFSTTTRAEQVAAAITCMDAFSPYFDYVMYCGCGFPKITLHGMVEDWLALKAKIIEIEELFAISAEVNLTWWTTKIKQVVDQLIAAAQGQPDITWWKKMYKQVDVYLDYQFNGWIGWLWPYTKTHDIWVDGAWIKPERKWKRNPMLSSDSPTSIIIKKDEGVYGIDKDGNKITIPDKTYSLEGQTIPYIGFSSSVSDAGFMYTSDFPLGLSKVDLKIIDVMGMELDTVLIGGFVGVSQDDEGGLAPEIGYGLLA